MYIWRCGLTLYALGMAVAEFRNVIDSLLLVSIESPTVVVVIACYQMKFFSFAGETSKVNILLLHHHPPDLSSPSVKPYSYSSSMP